MFSTLRLIHLFIIFFIVIIFIIIIIYITIICIVIIIVIFIILILHYPYTQIGSSLRLIFSWHSLFLADS